MVAEPAGGLAGLAAPGRAAADRAERGGRRGPAGAAGPDADRGRAAAGVAAAARVPVRRQGRVHRGRAAGLPGDGLRRTVRPGRPGRGRVRDPGSADGRHQAAAGVRRAADRSAGGHPRGDPAHRRRGRTAAARAVLGGRGPVRRRGRLLDLLPAGGLRLPVAAAVRGPGPARPVGPGLRRGPAPGRRRLGPRKRRRRAGDGPREVRAADRRRGPGPRAGGAGRTALARRRAAGRDAGGRRERQRSGRDDHGGQPAGLPAEQPERAGQPRDPEVPDEQPAAGRAVPADPGAGRVQRRQVGGLRAAPDRRAGTAARPAGARLPGPRHRDGGHHPHQRGGQLHPALPPHAVSGDLGGDPRQVAVRAGGPVPGRRPAGPGPVPETSRAPSTRCAASS